MKTGRFFWGAFFVAIGLIMLLTNLGYLQFDWGGSWRLWPLILVFWGLSKFTENRAVRVSLSTVNGIILACIVFGFFSFQWIDINFDETTPVRYSQHFSEPFDSTIDKAEFTFSGGAGKFVIDGTTQDLIQAQTENGLGRYDLDRYDDDGTAVVALKMRDRRPFRFFGRLRNRADIQLNVRPGWTIKFESGASKLDLDLRPFKAERVTIDAGLSTINLKLGDRADEAYVRIKTGVSTVRIEVPESAGCEIRDDTHVGSTHYVGFTKESRHTWQTDDFESATKKIYLELNTGVSSVRVKRY